LQPNDTAHSNSTRASDPDQRSWFLVALPFAGYVCAYAYEHSYCSYFRIPTSFVVVSWEEVLSPAILTILVLSMVVFFMLSPSAINITDHLPRVFLLYATMLAGLFSGILLFWFSTPSALIFAGIAAITIPSIAVRDIRRIDSLSEDVKPSRLFAWLFEWKYAMRIFTSWRTFKEQGIAAWGHPWGHPTYIPLRLYGALFGVRSAVLVAMFIWVIVVLRSAGHSDELTDNVESTSWVLGSMCVVVTILSVFAIIFGRGRALVNDPTFGRRTLVDLAITRYGLSNYLSALGAVTLLGVFSLLGHFDASRERSFLLITVGQPSATYIVLRKYGDELVTARYDRSLISRRFQIFDDKSKSLEMMQQYISGLGFTDD
jgi:hypothetical protein